ncbi:MAG: methyltransferase [Candidatus Faecousia sp.]|nr:methyltransferase [Candidatus Faecousia sp.]
MEKVLVEVFVPSLKASYDMFLPAEAMMYDVLKLICKAITDLSGGKFVSDENTILCYRGNGAIININLSVFELDIHNGTKLMLI